MKLYLVGGAVRDELLGRPVKERDWVVVGGTPEAMQKQGFKPVGKDFPVFLHPKTHEEYALARTERKIAKGYKGFEFYADPKVTLEEDLLRRDLTINAIAKDEDGKLIDPYGGLNDLKQKSLHHVSPAFSEDPVRILRVARFAARFTDFQVAADTNQLMRLMVANGEVDALVAERVWKEFDRALSEENPVRFFKVLNSCGAMPILFPEISMASDGMAALGLAAKKADSVIIRFACLFINLDANKTKQLNLRYKTPNPYSELALLVSQFFDEYRRVDNYGPEDILKLLKLTDALRRPQRFQHFLKCCEIGSEILQEKNYRKKSDLLKQALTTIKNIDTTALQQQNLPGQEFAEKLKALQLIALEKITSFFN